MKANTAIDIKLYFGIRILINELASLKNIFYISYNLNTIITSFHATFRTKLVIQMYTFKRKIHSKDASPSFKCQEV